jgi:hydrogenase maturation protease
MASSVLVIGIGNDLRGDDAAGLEVTRRLRERELPSGMLVRAHSGEAVALLDLWSSADTVLLVDTILGGAAPGTIHRIDLSQESLPAPLRSTSTHALGIDAAIELGRALRRLPATVIVYGVEGHRFEFGTALSREVAEAIEPLADALVLEAASSL